MKFTLYFFSFSLVAFGQSDFQKTEQFFATKQFSKAENLMISYVKSHPNDLSGIELLGDAYGHQKKWDEAIESYKNLVELSPETANYHYKYGGALGMKALSVNKIQALGIIGDVKEAFTTAAELDPKHIETRWALVELYMQLPGIIGGSKNKSLKYAEELYRISKVDGFLAKGYIYEYDKDFDAAEKYYKLAVTEGGSLHCYEQLTNLYEAKNQPELMISTMQAALNKHRSNALNYQIGKVSADYKIQLDKGAMHLQHYLENYEKEDGISKSWANYRLAQIHKLQKNKVEALKYIDLAIGESPRAVAFKKERVAILKL
ncbi:tetratricopeptide repeat protein [Gelidibacter salicanalis]|uniref:Tetratricopeptide repeat protein n=1 Tax=Gelidibacter salicanalis TaxID=291193 RepID=A0A934KPT3_9FLAO|nr:tetratricopeptide repeat protein [Gelidibacter salicanalis]MBJ7879236.1 tetratricopeptide repeat protein [Gelidibacter salicanalis]